VNGVVEVAVFTADVPAVREFYARLLDAEPDAEWDGGAVFAVGAVKLLVHERAGASADGPPNEDHVAVGVAGLDEACRRLTAAGASLLVSPREYPWGRSAYLRDPDGRLVELSEL
jgi:catechol 2,3-dioxygenase-like lactoylglutathione lyase family enzyme